MEKNKNYLALTSGLTVLLIVVWFTTSNCGGDTFRVIPEISIPEQRSDSARAIDAYERMIERYMDMTERNFNGIGADFRNVLSRLDSIDAKLTKLSTRIARIERAVVNKQSRKSVKRKRAKTQRSIITAEPNSQPVK